MVTAGFGSVGYYFLLLIAHFIPVMSGVTAVFVVAEVLFLVVCFILVVTAYVALILLVLFIIVAAIAVFVIFSLLCITALAIVTLMVAIVIGIILSIVFTGPIGIIASFIGMVVFVVLFISFSVLALLVFSSIFAVVAIVLGSGLLFIAVNMAIVTIFAIVNIMVLRFVYEFNRDYIVLPLYYWVDELWNNFLWDIGWLEEKPKKRKREKGEMIADEYESPITDADILDQYTQEDKYGNVIDD